MVLHVQLSTNSKLGCLRNKKNIFLSTNSQFFNGLTTVQVVDPLPLYRDFPGWDEMNSRQAAKL
jgi:hypothetical protein